MANFASSIGRFAVPLALGAAVVQSSIYDVQGYQRAVIFDRYRGVLPESVGSGTHFIIPWLQKAVIYDTRLTPQTVPTQTPSADMQTVSVTLRILSRPDLNKLPDTYQRLGTDFAQRVMPSVATEVLKSTVAQFNAAELIEQREVVSSKIRGELIRRLEEFNIEIKDVSLISLTFGEAFTSAVEQKQIAEQASLTARYRVELAEREREASVIRSEGEAEAAALVGAALTKAGAAYIQLAQIDASKAIATSLAQNRNVSYLPASAGNVLMQVPT